MPKAKPALSPNWKVVCTPSGVGTPSGSCAPGGVCAPCGEGRAWGAAAAREQGGVQKARGCCTKYVCPLLIALSGGVGLVAEVRVRMHGGAEEERQQQCARQQTYHGA